MCDCCYEICMLTPNYAECHIFIVMFSVVMLKVIMLIIIVPNAILKIFNQYLKNFQQLSIHITVFHASASVTSRHSHQGQTSFFSKFTPGTTCGLYYKCFAIVIYDRNDCGQYYKTTIIIKASLASLSWIINYSHSLCSKLKCYLRLQIYNRKPFIVQATE